MIKMSNTKLVKVDNWGIYFLQRLKNFFNRTDYCDLTLQFQDKAQLKVHRLVLSACTEYFEVLERTCEMYEDCLVMPDDLQADVVVPIINFMYTGQLEFSMSLLEKLYQTSQIMNMPILTKLLNSHRTTKSSSQMCDLAPKKYVKRVEKPKLKKQVNTPVTPVNNKRSYGTAFSKNNEENIVYKTSKSEIIGNDIYSSTAPSSMNAQSSSTKKISTYDPRPTRYELPEELDTDTVFDSSFSNISYTSQPLMVHPETRKRYSKAKSNDPSSSKRLEKDHSTLEIVECRKLPSDNIFEDSFSESVQDVDIYPSSYMNSKETAKDSSQLFDQIVEQNDVPKVTIETKNSKVTSNLDHAKIISEVLKKYPHLVKSNKNIKLKILNTPNKARKESQFEDIPKKIKQKSDEDFTYETDVIDSMQAAKLIALGAENVKGPWICLICGTPGKALHFTSYLKFRRHLVNVHKEKPISTICEYCGLKALKRNYMVHHLYTQHGVPPPPQYKFPKCNRCNYIALTEGFLAKHKVNHVNSKRFLRNVCSKSYCSSQDLQTHIQATGHKYTSDKKSNLQCIYCLKVFLRDYNLYAHLKSHHKQEAKEDGIIESDEEQTDEKPKPRENKITIKYEEPPNSHSEYELQYEIQENPGGSIQIVTKKQSPTTPKQKILNPGFGNQKPTPIVIPQLSNLEDDDETEDIVMINNIEYIVKNDQLVLKNQKDSPKEDYIMSDMLTNTDQSIDSVIPTSSIKFNNINTANIEQQNPQSQRVIINKQATINHPIQIVVSNEEEYKALLAGSHPIIFDNSNVNKTLTVLATPSNATLSTAAINMNNTSTNDMMIIPETYPMSVSDTVTANNSNIVVVYSHPVDNQNKQFQLVTPTQSLDTRFIQSPAIISQNYETITTNTTVLSTHTLDTPESWPNSVHETIIEQEQQVPITEVETINNPNNIKIGPNDDENNTLLVELPEVQLSQQTSETLVTEFKDETIINSNEVAAEVDESAQKVISDNVPTVPMKSEQPAESVVSKDQEHMSVIETEEIIENHNESILTAPQEESIIEHTSDMDQVEMIENGENVLHQTEHECYNEPITEQTDVLVEKEQPEQKEPIEVITYVSSPTYTQEEANVEEAINMDSNSQKLSTEIAEPPETSETNVAIVPITHKNIDNIALEWSEDEYDVVNDKESGECQINLNNDTQNDEVTVEPAVEIEESIENIQRAINSSAVLDSPAEVDEAANGKSDNIISDVVEDINSAEDGQVDVSSDDPQNKISSLLNDWEDNDSQEENNSLNEIDHGEPVESQDTEKSAPTDNETVSEPQEVKASEANIKSLVSDWDDDEE